MDTKNIGKNIAQVRRNNGYTQETLAERLNISPQAVSKWETGLGLPEASMLVELSDVFNISIDELLLHVKKQNTAADFFNRNFNAPATRVLDYIPKIERWLPPSGTSLTMLYSMPATIAEAICCVEAQERGESENIICADIIDRYLDLMHVMGIGYGFLWLDHENMINELWRINDYLEMIDRAMKYFGRDYLWLTSREASPEELQKTIVWSISKGRPVVMEWAGNIPEFSIITGYEDSGNILIGWTYCTECVHKTTDNGMFVSSARWDDAKAISKNKYKILVIGDKNGSTLSDRDTLEYALQVLERTESVDRDFDTYIAGDSAYRKWLEDSDTTEKTIKINSYDTFFSIFLLMNSLYAQQCTIPYYKKLAQTRGTEIHDIVIQLDLAINEIEEERNKLGALKGDPEAYADAWRHHIENLIEHRKITRNWLEELLKLVI